MELWNFRYVFLLFRHKVVSMSDDYNLPELNLVGFSILLRPLTSAL